MRNPMVHGLKNLTNFSEREARLPFWLYIGSVFGAMTTLGMIIMIPFIVNFVTTGRNKIAEFARENPDKVTVTQGPGHYSMHIDGHVPGLMPDFGPFMIVAAVSAAIHVALMASAIARRLHDVDRTALWGVLPLPFLIFSLAAFPGMFKNMAAGSEPDIGLFFLIFASNLVYLITLVLLGVLMIPKGSDGPNRFGPQPVES